MDYYEHYLSHYGIKGQKWGTRRFQNEDGTLTAEGRARYLEELGRLKLIRNDAKKEYKKSKPPLYKRHSDALLQYRNNRASFEFSRKEIKDAKAKYRMENGSLKNSKRRKNLEEKYIKEGMSKEDAAIAAYRRAKTERTLAIAGGVAIAAAGSYAAYRHYDLYADKLLKSGTKIQRVSSSNSSDLQKPFYASYKKGDIKKYEGLFGYGELHRLGGNQEIYKLNTEVGKNGIKIAGKKNSLKTLNEMLNDKEFKDNLKNNYSNLASLSNDRKKYTKFLNDMAKGKLDHKDYELFNKNLYDHSHMNQPIVDKFYEEMRKNGYGGILDILDKKSIGYKTKAPTIFLNGKDFVNTKVSSLDLNDAHNKFTKQALNVFFRKYVYRSPYTYLGAGVAGSGIASKKIIRKKNTSNRWNQEIASYKKEHPNTKLSDREILRNIYGRK